MTRGQLLALMAAMVYVPESVPDYADRSASERAQRMAARRALARSHLILQEMKLFECECADPLSTPCQVCVDEYAADAVRESKPQ